MNPRYVISKQIFGLDYKVWLAMITCIALSSALFGYRLTTDEPCSTNIISARSTYNSEANFFIGEPIRFKTNGKANKLKWIFGDGSIEEQSSSVISHTYTREGRYVVSAETNAGCRATFVIAVVKKIEREGEALAVRNDEYFIIGKKEVPVNKPADFSSFLNAESYEWTVLNRNDYPRQYTREASFIFKLPETYTVRLMLNNDKQKTYLKVINAYPEKKSNSNHSDLPFKALISPGNINNDSGKHSDPKPEEKVPENTKEPAIERRVIEVSDMFLRKSLEGIMNGSKTINALDTFLCAGGQTHVLLNKEHKYITFEELCGKIRNRKFRIDNVTALRENESGRCILNISVTVKKKNFLGKWVDL